MKKNKCHTIQQIRVCTYGGSLCITSTRSILKTVFDRIVNQNIMENYDMMFTENVYLRHYCISTNDDKYFSSLMLSIDDKYNSLDKIVELSNLLTSLHYEILRQEKTSHVILQQFSNIQSAITQEQVATHDALPRKRKVKSPFKDANSQSNNETKDQ